MHNSLFPLFGLSRLRMQTDGAGVTTLVAAQGCPLRCRMCINPLALNENARAEMVSPEQLYDRVKIDDLYFQATGGGVTFGGGEPLMHADFIRDFAQICGGRWNLLAETSLNVPTENVIAAAECLNGFIVDIKDMNPEIYRRYTRCDNAPAIRNLQYLIARVGADRIVARVPDIPNFNTPADIEYSMRALRDMGIARFDRFAYIHPRITAIDAH